MSKQTRKQWEFTGEIVRPCDLPRLTGLSRSTIYRLEKANGFVPKIRLTQTSCGYRRRDIERWLDERTEAVGSQQSPVVDTNSQSTQNKSSNNSMGGNHHE